MGSASCTPRICSVHVSRVISNWCSLCVVYILELSFGVGAVFELVSTHPPTHPHAATTATHTTTYSIVPNLIDITTNYLKWSFTLPINGVSGLPNIMGGVGCVAASSRRASVAGASVGVVFVDVVVVAISVTVIKNISGHMTVVSNYCLCSSTWGVVGSESSIGWLVTTESTVLWPRRFTPSPRGRPRGSTEQPII